MARYSTCLSSTVLSFLSPFCSQNDLSKWHTSLKSPLAHLNNNVHENFLFYFTYLNFLNNSFFQFLSKLRKKKNSHAFMVVKTKSKFCNYTTYIREFKLTFFALKKLESSFPIQEIILADCCTSQYLFPHLFFFIAYF